MDEFKGLRAVLEWFAEEGRPMADYENHVISEWTWSQGDDGWQRYASRMRFWRIHSFMFSHKDSLHEFIA